MMGAVIACSSAVLLLAVIFCVLALVSRLRYKRSLMATVSEIYLKIASPKFSEKRAYRIFERQFKKADEKVKIPRAAGRFCKYREAELYGVQTLIYNEEKSSDSCLLYLHGSTYVRKPRYWHFRFASRLASLTGAAVVFPIYPKAPKNTASKVFPIMEQIYSDIRERYGKVILIGDSAGAGLALGLAEGFGKKGIQAPDRLILMSAWVDISLANSCISGYKSRDPMVCTVSTRMWGRAWRGELSSSDYRVSPIYGDMMGLCPVTVFVGTREVLYPDTKMLVDMLRDSRVKVDLHIGEGLNHVYPIYPIPEAKQALRQILSAIEITCKSTVAEG